MQSRLTDELWNCIRVFFSTRYVEKQDQNLLVFILFLWSIWMPEVNSLYLSDIVPWFFYHLHIVDLAFKWIGSYYNVKYYSIHYRKSIQVKLRDRQHFFWPDALKKSCKLFRYGLIFNFMACMIFKFFQKIWNTRMNWGVFFFVTCIVYNVVGQFTLHYKAVETQHTPHPAKKFLI